MSSHTFSATSGALNVAGRKGKRRWTQTPYHRDHAESIDTQKVETRSKVAYACTFCWETSKDRYNWSRHENTHVEPEAWTCMPNGLPAVDDTCVFCLRKFRPSSQGGVEHLIDPSSKCSCQRSRHVTKCLSKPSSERTFSTKDGLKGHIRRIHQADDGSKESLDKGAMTVLINQWSREKSPQELCREALWCGFCEKSFETWKARVAHVADHFRRPAHLKPWKEQWKPVPEPRFTEASKQDFGSSGAAQNASDNRKEMSRGLVQIELGSAQKERIQYAFFALDRCFC